ncbi:MAG: hypothetical protein LBS82_03375, partial [Spirochaetaceae bacterium]|nr:hypothetical protein [Spirochaetaceae bacterium]
DRLKMGMTWFSTLSETQPAPGGGDQTNAFAWGVPEDKVMALGPLNARCAAAWDATVAFDSQGGSAVAAQTVAAGGVAPYHAEPVKAGAFFVYTGRRLHSQIRQRRRHHRKRP